MVKLLYFSADWCGPCKTQSPIIDDIKEDYSDLEINKIDIDDNQEIANQYQVRSLPTILLLLEDDEDETIYTRFTGLTQQGTLEDAIEEAKEEE